MKKSILSIILLLSALMFAFALPGLSSAQGSDPATIYKALVTAQNAHDADAATALFSDDGIAIAGTRIYKGADSIKAWFQVQATINYHIDPGTPLVTNDMLLVQDKISTDAFTKLGLAPLTDDVQVVVA